MIFVLVDAVVRNYRHIPDNKPVSSAAAAGTTFLQDEKNRESLSILLPRTMMIPLDFQLVVFSPPPLF
jgi:hypothetical protein